MKQVLWQQFPHPKAEFLTLDDRAQARFRAACNGCAMCATPTRGKERSGGVLFLHGVGRAAIQPTWAAPFVIADPLLEELRRYLPRVLSGPVYVPPRGACIAEGPIPLDRYVRKHGFSWIDSPPADRVQLRGGPGSIVKKCARCGEPTLHLLREPQYVVSHTVRGRRVFFDTLRGLNFHPTLYARLVKGVLRGATATPIQQFDAPIDGLRFPEDRRIPKRATSPVSVVVHRLRAWDPDNEMPQPIIPADARWKNRLRAKGMTCKVCGALRATASDLAGDAADVYVPKTDGADIGEVTWLRGGPVTLLRRDVAAALRIVAPGTLLAPVRRATDGRTVPTWRAAWCPGPVSFLRLDGGPESVCGGCGAGRVKAGPDRCLNLREVARRDVFQDTEGRLYVSAPVLERLREVGSDTLESDPIAVVRPKRS